MAPTGSDGTTTDLAEPQTANSSSDDDAANSDTPFGDWREQLRERVKEIRARKHAVHREDVDEIALNEDTTAATEEKLDAARAQSAESQSVDDLSMQLVEGERANRRADIAGIVDDLLGGPEPAPAAVEQPAPSTPEAAVEEPEAPQELLAEPEDQVEEATPELLAEPVAQEEAPEQQPAEPEIAAAPTAPSAAESAVEEAPQELLTHPEEAVAELEQVTEDTSATPEPLPETETQAVVAELAPEEDLAEGHEEPLPAPDAAPLFQAEPTVFADDPILEIADEFEHREENAQAFEENAEEEPVAAAEPAVEIEPELAAEIDDFVDEPALPGDNRATDNPLLAGIPPELRDVEIPAWALPREPSRESQPAAMSSAETDEDAEPGAGDGKPDTFLVGEYTTPEGGKRTDLIPPPDTPIPTAELLDQRIGDLAALTEEALAEEAVEIAPPGSLVDAADFEPRDREEAPAASRALPGLFDVEDEPTDDAKPGLFFDEPLASDAPVAAATDDKHEAAPAAILDELSITDEPAPVAEEETSDPVDFFDEPLARVAPAETVAEKEPEPVAATEGTDTAVSPAEAVAKKTPPAELADEPKPRVEKEAATPKPVEDDALEWDADTDVDAELVADARRQHEDASAPMSDRVYSAVADAMVLLTIGLVLMIAGASAAGSPVLPFVQAAPLPFLAAWSLFGLVYGVIFVGTCGQTLGKMAMRVRVIGADTFHVGYGRAALRACAYAAAALPAGLGLLTAIKDPEHRGLHDRLTSTRVVKA